jgi:hypothetical protein
MPDSLPHYQFLWSIVSSIFLNVLNKEKQYDSQSEKKKAY